MDDKLMFVTMFSGIWGLLGIIFFIIGILMLNNRKRKEMNCTSKTEGEVKDIVKHKTYNRRNGVRSYSYTWHPVFEYKIEELTFIKQSLYGSSQCKYAIGQKVEVCYNPQNYNDYYIAGETMPTTIATIFTIVGIVAVMIAIFSAILIL